MNSKSILAISTVAAYTALAAGTAYAADAGHDTYRRVVLGETVAAAAAQGAAPATPAYDSNERYRLWLGASLSAAPAAARAPAAALIGYDAYRHTVLGVAIDTRARADVVAASAPTALR